MTYKLDEGEVYYGASIGEALDVDVDLGADISAVSIIMEARQFLNAIQHMSLGTGLLQCIRFFCEYIVRALESWKYCPIASNNKRSTGRRNNFAFRGESYL